MINNSNTQATFYKMQLPYYSDWITAHVATIKEKVAMSKGHTQLERARAIKRTLGVKVAARYMAIRGWSIEAALHVLVGV